ncbi:DUF397 domain-containing protein [Amycolatopsis sp. NPDC059027]|uniref:DUF397 domain-containing protein n=1 Tax=Amycolatopsis sp. NPDC059027 TaxID=3346709 RepID=UPI00366B6020
MPPFFRTARSGKETSGCVEVAQIPPFTAVRDSTAPTGNLTVSHHAWARSAPPSLSLKGRYACRVSLRVWTDSTRSWRAGWP